MSSMSSKIDCLGRFHNGRLMSSTPEEILGRFSLTLVSGFFFCGFLDSLCSFTGFSSAFLSLSSSLSLFSSSLFSPFSCFCFFFFLSLFPLLSLLILQHSKLVGTQAWLILGFLLESGVERRLRRSAKWVVIQITTSFSSTLGPLFLLQDGTPLTTASLVNHLRAA